VNFPLSVSRAVGEIDQGTVDWIVHVIECAQRMAAARKIALGAEAMGAEEPVSRPCSFHYHAAHDWTFRN
jgi:hypothetical protein